MSAAPQAENQRIIDQILVTLRNATGEQLSPYAMSRKIGQALASTRQTMADLATSGVIRRAGGGTKSGTAYYMPTVAQLAAEARGLESRWRPLKTRTEHAERIARVRAERDAIPSLF